MEPSPGHGLQYFLINYPSPGDLDSLGLYIPSPGHIAWDVECIHKTVWAVGLGIFDPGKNGSLVQALNPGRCSGK